MVVLSLLKVLTNFVRQKQLFLLNKLTVLSDKGILLVEQITVLSDKAFLLVEQKTSLFNKFVRKSGTKTKPALFFVGQKSVCRTKNSLFLLNKTMGNKVFQWNSTEGSPSTPDGTRRADSFSALPSGRGQSRHWSTEAIRPCLTFPACFPLHFPRRLSWDIAPLSIMKRELRGIYQLIARVRG